MSAEQLLIYLGALLAIHLAPGPDNILVLSTAASRGWRAARSVALGISSALVLHTLLSIGGISVLLATSPLAFDLLRWIGAAYLLWLGIQSLRPGAAALSQGLQESGWALWRRGLLNNLLNPKAWLFCALFLPQFINPQRGEVMLQGLQLGLMLVLFNLAFLIGLALLAGRLAGRFVNSKSVFGRWLMGSVFIGLAVRMLLLENVAAR
ncbi:LysE family translocator [Marinobacterium arenosum]|uniref:LysE family translocator n=1 Tax=Marinobacterium arenosum TaxID=2862496 RepID=UPI001C9799D8|nr:LysE family translocator [Marinobacterium arenosum]MBY4678590.1 LysE family translocator [Marinobacterium arenosum]